MWILLVFRILPGSLVGFYDNIWLQIMDFWLTLGVIWLSATLLTNWGQKRKYKKDYYAVLTKKSQRGLSLIKLQLQFISSKSLHSRDIYISTTTMKCVMQPHIRKKKTNMKLAINWYYDRLANKTVFIKQFCCTFNDTRHTFMYVTICVLVILYSVISLNGNIYLKIYFYNKKARYTCFNFQD